MVTDSTVISIVIVEVMSDQFGVLIKNEMVLVPNSSLLNMW